MRTSDHYVQVKVTPEEKERFLRMTKACRFTEKTTLLKILEEEELRGYPPEGFDNVFYQLGKISVNTAFIADKGLSDDERSELFWRYHAFDQYVQLVKRAMIYIAVCGIDTEAEYKTKNQEKEIEK